MNSRDIYGTARSLAKTVFEPIRYLTEHFYQPEPALALADSSSSQRYFEPPIAMWVDPRDNHRRKSRKRKKKGHGNENGKSHRKHQDSRKVVVRK